MISTYDELRNHVQCFLTPFEVLIALCLLKHSSFVVLVYKAAHPHKTTEDIFIELESIHTFPEFSCGTGERLWSGKLALNVPRDVQNLT